MRVNATKFLLIPLIIILAMGSFSSDSFAGVETWKKMKSLSSEGKVERDKCVVKWVSTAYAKYVKEGKDHEIVSIGLYYRVNGTWKSLTDEGKWGTEYNKHKGEDTLVDEGTVDDVKKLDKKRKKNAKAYIASKGRVEGSKQLEKLDPCKEATYSNGSKQKR